MNFHNFQILRHILHLQVGPDHDLMYSLNLLKDVSFFIFSCSTFHIFGPSVMRLLLPYFSLLQFLTSKSKGRTLELVLDVKIVFMKWGFRSLAVLSISVASVLILLIFMDSLLFLTRRVL